MLSPNTAPGTKVVCIDASSSKNFGINVKVAEPYDAAKYLELYKVYTVTRVNQHYKSKTGFSVELAEIPPRDAGDLGFSTARFKPAVLPKELTSLLEVVEVKDKEDA